MTTSSRKIVALTGWAMLIGALFGVATLWLAIRQDHPQALLEQRNTPAELLVGKWKLVNTNTTPPTEFQVPIEFTTDGNVIAGIENYLTDAPETRGKYRLVGDTLWIFMEPPLHQHLGRRRISIDFATEDKLIAVAWAGADKRDVYEFERRRDEPRGR